MVKSISEHIIHKWRCDDYGLNCLSLHLVLQNIFLVVIRTTVICAIEKI